MKTSPRYEVISLRVNKERRAVLERYRRALSDRFSRAVSMAEAAFLIIEDRVEQVDLITTRYELHHAPTASLYRIRQRWTSEHTLSAAEWDLLAEYLQVATEAGRQEPPCVRPAIPSRESYLALLDAFEAVYQQRAEYTSPQAWAYVASLDGSIVARSEDDPDQRHHAVPTQIAHRRDDLSSPDAWQCPGNIGWCLRTAIRHEGVDSTKRDQVLAPYWATLWGLAARGHWIQHCQPVRPVSAQEHPVRQGMGLQRPITRGDLTLSFLPSAGPEFTTEIDFGSSRRFTYRIRYYPELIEFRSMLENARDQSWYGRYFWAAMSHDQKPAVYTLRFNQQELRVDLSAREWNDLRDLFRQAWQSPDLQWWLETLREEYGEQG